MKTNFRDVAHGARRAADICFQPAETKLFLEHPGGTKVPWWQWLETLRVRANVGPRTGGFGLAAASAAPNAATYKAIELPTSCAIGAPRTSSSR